MDRGWVCEICGKDLLRVNRGRIRRGERILTRRAVTCSPECSAHRKHELEWKSDWRCDRCGIAMAKANALRARRGLRPIPRGSRACSRECRSALNDRRRAELARGKASKLPPLHRGSRGEWVCSECGVDLGGARQKRLRAGLIADVRLGQRVCTPACRKAFLARLSRWVLARAAKRAPR